MTDRRTQAFAVLDEWTTGIGLEGPTVRERQMIAALRSVLERHQPYILRTSEGPKPRWCVTCGYDVDSPCPDETAVIDALLGEEGH